MRPGVNGWRRAGLRNIGAVDTFSSVMRFFIFVISLLLAAPLRAEMPALLHEALQKFFADYDRWAYTQTRIERDDKGKIVREEVVRFDPSKPYEKQFTPLLIDGKPPSEHQLAKFRRQGEKRGDRLEKAEKEGVEPARKTLGESMDLERAAAVEEKPQSVTYEVPLKKDGNKRLPPEKFRVAVRVSREQRAFENIQVELREPMRAQLIVKIKSGAGRLEFATVDPKFAPTLVAIQGEAAASIMFVPLGRSYDVKRTEFKRVKPFAERFDVKFGPLKTIDF